MRVAKRLRVLRFKCCRCVTDALKKVRALFQHLPHMPTLVMSGIFWWFYQVYTCGYLALIENGLWSQLFYALVVCSGIGMTAASVYSTTLQRYPIRPAKFSVGPNFEKLSREKRNKLIERVIQRSGANPSHVTKVCQTCRIIRPERAHHCAICDVCTPRMDHHCVALHKCIHYKNQKQFILFFYWMCFSLAVALTSFHSYAMRAISEVAYDPTLPFALPNHYIIGYSYFYARYLGPQYTFANVWVVSLVISSILAYFLLIIFSCVFVAAMWFCVIQNGTIVACNKATRLKTKYPWIFLVDTKTRCFRKPTVIENVQVVFGKNCLHWVLPFPNSDSDGWLHDCSCTSVGKMNSP